MFGKFIIILKLLIPFGIKNGFSHSKHDQLYKSKNDEEMYNVINFSRTS